MSGQAGSTIYSTYYMLNYSSGVSVSPATPPNWYWEKNGDYTTLFFATENKFYNDKLKAIQPELDILFNNLIRNSNLPILPFDINAKNIVSYTFCVHDLEQVTLNLTVSSEIDEEDMKGIVLVIRPLFES